MQPDAVNPRTIALTAKMIVAKCFGFLYTASKYTFSPPERGNMVPNSSQMKSPQNESTKPSTQSMSEAPTDPTEPRMEEGVEKMPVPMIRPTLRDGGFVNGGDWEWIVYSHEQRTAEHTEMAPHATRRICNMLIST